MSRSSQFSQELPQRSWIRDVEAKQGGADELKGVALAFHGWLPFLDPRSDASRGAARRGSDHPLPVSPSGFDCALIRVRVQDCHPGSVKELEDPHHRSATREIDEGLTHLQGLQHARCFNSVGLAFLHGGLREPHGRLRLP